MLSPKSLQESFFLEESAVKLLRIVVSKMHILKMVFWKKIIKSVFFKNLKNLHKLSL